MQERYAVVEYKPYFNIVRHRDEYMSAGLQNYAHVHVVKETRPDGRHRWKADGNSSKNYYSVMFSRDEWKVVCVHTDHRTGRSTRALSPDTQEFQDIAAEVTEFFVRMSTTTINGSEARK
ncbi:hypothetical protein HMPREF3056_04990 [Corynebacterium sp. HMSC056F09]|uniref:hypothetical protein n=1 Tax=Corynebacterium sp. HMSC056F09 TaxID=1739548 RepID=UPI0008A2292A|nr:hypothetical protein [Corynebacterium sp. HMSC056F09]OFO23251.1 hypothetical protein HMPREF3056_04990 [Corynebacterium sp. HMSC056F09]